MMKPSERVFMSYITPSTSDTDGDVELLKIENETLKNRVADLEEKLSYFQDAEGEGQPDSEG